jgi:HK97 family phage prohead protease
MPPLEYKSFAIADAATGGPPSVSHAGEFAGLAAVIGNVDLGGDEIQPGAFAGATGKQVPILFSHKTEEPIGLGSLRETPKALEIRGQLNQDTQRGREVRALMIQGALRGLSIGYEVQDKGYRGNVRLLKRVNVVEVSPVVFGMNPLALVSLAKESDEAALRSLKEVTWKNQAFLRLYRAESRVREHTQSAAELRSQIKAADPATVDLERLKRRLASLESCYDSELALMEMHAKEPDNAQQIIGLNRSLATLEGAISAARRDLEGLTRRAA